MEIPIRIRRIRNSEFGPYLFLVKTNKHGTGAKVPVSLKDRPDGLVLDIGPIRFSLGSGARFFW